MPVNAGNIGYGNVPVSASETAPLLMPEPASLWKPMTKEELEAADGPGWRKVRFYLVLLFWLAWVAMLTTSAAIIIKSSQPVAAPLKWWQKSLFYQLQVHKQLPYLRSLGIGALILRGVFDVEVSPLNLTATDANFGTLAWMQHLLSESRKARALHFWLEHGVSGFVICDTDAAYSEKLFSSLSFSRAREEALQCGTFTFLPFNTSLSSNSSCFPPLCPPILAFLRSWGCVHFLVLLNVGPEPHTLDPTWASRLPEAGMFVASTGMDRFGSASLYTLRLQPYEAIVIKLFEAGSHS
uniref:Si:dkey-202g17.3 n=1 Tax=Amphilophus citrinellus TaxID=61819 RepID=A0A3Q0SUK6_AMPCI